MTSWGHWEGTSWSLHSGPVRQSLNRVTLVAWRRRTVFSGSPAGRVIEEGMQCGTLYNFLVNSHQNPFTCPLALPLILLRETCWSFSPESDGLGVNTVSHMHASFPLQGSSLYSPRSTCSQYLQWKRYENTLEWYMHVSQSIPNDIFLSKNFCFLPTSKEKQISYSDVSAGTLPPLLCA